MTDENSQEFVVIRGKKFFVHNNTLEILGIPTKLSEIQGLENLNNLKGLS